MSKCGDMPIDEMLATLNVIGSRERCRQLRAGELVISEPIRRWREEDGVIYFSVTSDGTTGAEWIERLEKKGYCVRHSARYVLCSEDFKPTNGITTQLAVLKGKLFNDREDRKRLTSNIRAEAERRKLETPNAEVACLIRDMFTDKEIEEMGISWIITMHEPINLSILGMHSSNGKLLLDAFSSNPESYWDGSGVFAFSVSQK
jgi:hypothetical protein